MKLIITDDNGRTICKIGTSVVDPAGLEYTDQELGEFLAEMSRMLLSPELADTDLDPKLLAALV